LSYIAAATAALRRRVDALKATGEPEAEGGDFHRPEDALMAEAVMAELKNVKEQLRPLATLASEFKLKWDKQRARMLAQREAEVLAHMKTESEAMLDRAERAAEEELRAVVCTSELASQDASHKVSSGHKPQLEATVELWKQRVRGAPKVKHSDVDKALRAALQRVADWAADEERHIMQNWTGELSRVVTEAHSLDEESLVAAEDTQSARRAVLERALQRHWRGLQTFRTELQDRIVQGAQELQDAPGETSRRRRQEMQSGAVAATLAKRAWDRINTAKAEASRAVEEQRKAAETLIDTVAQREVLRAQHYDAAVREVGPLVKARLDGELKRLRETFLAEQQAAASEAAAAAAEDGPQAVKSHGAGIGLSGSFEPNASPFSRYGGRLASRRTTGGLSRKSIVPGADLAARPSAFQVGESSFYRRRSTVSRQSRVSLGTDVFSQREDMVSSATEDSDGSVNSEREEAIAREERIRLVHQLRQQLQQAQVAVGKGDWNGDWRRDLTEAVNLGRQAIRDAEAALEGQGKAVLRSDRSDNDATAQMFSDTFVEMAERAKSHVAELRTEMVKLRNAKAGFAMTRAGYFTDLMQQIENDAGGVETDSWLLVSKMTREAETCIEVGRTIDRGADRFPVAVIAGAWRRSVAAALPLLPRIWEVAGVDEARQLEFADRLLAILAKTKPGLERLRDQATGRRDQKARAGPSSPRARTPSPPPPPGRWSPGSSALLQRSGA